MQSDTRDKNKHLTQEMTNTTSGSLGSSIGFDEYHLLCNQESKWG